MNRYEMLWAKLEEALAKSEDNPAAYRLLSILLGDHGKAAQLAVARQIIAETSEPTKH